MIAEILARKPKYIFLDEPTSMIDSKGKEEIYEIIKSLKKEGYTIICITNNADEILIADRTLILSDGHIVNEISRKELTEKFNIFKEFDIKEPTILQILSRLKENNINIDLQDFTADELVTKLKEILKV